MIENETVKEIIKIREPNSDKISVYSIIKIIKETEDRIIFIDKFGIKNEFLKEFIIVRFDNYVRGDSK